MMSLRLPGFSIALIALFILPWLALIGLGAYWLWLNGWLYHAVGILAANSLLVYTLLKWRQSQAKPLIVEPFVVSANPNWPDRGRLAFEGLEPLIQHWQNESDLFLNTQKLVQLSNEVLLHVARHFHTDSKYPILEFPLPYLLKLIILVCEDLQHQVLDKIPGSHAVSMSDLLRAKDGLTAIKTGFSFLNIAGWLWNPYSSALAKARSLLLGRGYAKITGEISNRLISVYVKKLAYYATQLYSGQITLETIVPTEILTPYSNTDVSQAQEQERRQEPLRILVMGQVSSGKSALINALFGEIKAAENGLPTTADTTPYVLEREGLNYAIILDSAGYGGLQHPEAETALTQEWAKVDVILLVSHAVKAARQADLAQLNAIRTYFQQQKQVAMPVVIAVVTHIDQLRPLREWQPPYNYLQPDTPKAHAIAAARQAIAEELHLPFKLVVPVCLNPAYDIYNIDEDNGLMSVIYDHLNDIQRVRYLRCLSTQKGRRSWMQWRKQIKNVAGTFDNLL